MNISIIGAGNVGLTLAVLLQKNGRFNVAIGARSMEKATKALCELEVEIPVFSMAEAASRANVAVLTVSDGAITDVCDELASAFPLGASVIHCSGALTSDALASAKDKGCHVASMHPLQTFPSVKSSLDKVTGTYCYYEADTAAVVAAEQLCSALGMQPVAIHKSAKTLYHASAVMACNYLSALMDASLELAESAGIERDVMWASLDPLVVATLDNMRKVGPGRALTGPIQRGDVATVEKHLSAIQQRGRANSAISVVYASLGKQAVKMSLRAGLPKQKAEVLESLLNRLPSA